MTTVFIGGSRAISILKDVIREQLDNLITKKCAIFVGDANGTDKAVQKYFSKKRYLNVTVLGTYKSFYKLSNEEELDALLARCDQNSIRDLKRRLEP